MSIIARCECGKAMAVADALAGKSIRCSKCGGQIEVPVASSAPASARRAKADATPSVSINPMLIVAATVAMIVLVIVLAIYFGPVAVGKQWGAMSAQANTQVTDTVEFAIQAYESENGMYDANESHNAPRADGEANFVAPYMAFNLPRRIPFVGKTNQGNYIGTYDTTNGGEIVADIETGGYTVGGLVDVKKANGKFHMTGREKDGKPSAEVDGTPLHIVMRKPLGKDE